MRRLACCALLLASCARALAQPAAEGGESARITLVQESCVARSYDPDAFAGLLQIELESLHITLNQAESVELAVQPGLGILHVTCDVPEAHLRVEFSDFVSGKRLQRELIVSDVEASARPRALALSVVLAMQSSWSELMLRGGAATLSLPPAVEQRLRQRLSGWAQPEPARPAPQPTAAAAELPVERASALALAGAVRAFPARNTGLIGAELAFSRDLAPLRLAFTAEALFGSQELSDDAGKIADYSLTWLTGGVMLLWASATRPELSIGPFGRIGYAWARGTSHRDGYTVGHEGGLVSALGLAALLRAPISASVQLSFGVDFGYVPNGVVFLADLARTAGMAEVTLAARAGADVSF